MNRATTTGPAPAGMSRRLDRIRRLDPPTALLSVAALFSLIAAVAQWQAWRPVSDVALIELRVRDTWGHLPLTGVYSRFGWNHPGPAEFYGLSPLYWLSGGSSGAIAVGSLVFQFGCVALAAWVVRRFSSSAAIAVIVGGTLALLSVPTDTLRSPWNPYVALGGVVLLVALAWSVAERRRLGFLGLLACGSVLVQAHVVTAPIVAVVTLAAILVAVWSPHHDRAMPWRTVGGGIGVAIVATLPTLVEQLTTNPGNLWLLIKGTAESDAPSVGLIDALKSASGAFGLVPSAIGNRTLTGYGESPHWSVPVWLIVVGVAGYLAVRGGQWTWLRGWAMALAAVIGSVASVAMIEVARFGAVEIGAVEYLQMGLRTSTLLLIAVSLAILAVTLPALLGWTTNPTWWKPSLLAISCVPAVLLCITGAMSIGSGSGTDEGVNALTHIAEGALKRQDVTRSERIEISHSVDFGAAFYGPALLLSLEKDGWNVQSDQMGERLVGEHRTSAGNTGPVIGELRLVSLPEIDKELADGWTLVDTFDPFTAEESRRLAAIEASAAALPLNHHGSSAELYDELQDHESRKQAITGGRIAAALVWRAR